MNCALQEQRTGVNTRETEEGAPHNHNLLLAVIEETDSSKTEFLINNI
jgi:hypothetical protein